MVLYPGGILPLRVFEQRYRTMVRCCREQGAPFGVVTLLSGSEVQSEFSAGERFHAVGTMARIQSVEALGPELELIECTGTERFRVTGSRQLSSGLWVGDVQLLPPDCNVPVPEDLQHSATALRQVLQRLPQRRPPPATLSQLEDCGWVANRWCELFPMDDLLQLQLLEIASPLLRLELVTDALEQSGIVERHQNDSSQRLAR